MLQLSEMLSDFLEKNKNIKIQVDSKQNRDLMHKSIQTKLDGLRRLNLCDNTSTTLWSHSSVSFDFTHTCTI